MKKTDVICKIMQRCGGNTKAGTIFCDEFAWSIRKLYPRKFECCSKDGRCMGREEGRDLRDKESECGFREECICGETCCGLGDNYCAFAHDILKEKEIKRLKEALPKIQSPSQKQQILYQLKLAGEPI